LAASLVASLVGDRYVISSAGVTPNEVSGKIRKARVKQRNVVAR
jgi:hypothetical protein